VTQDELVAALRRLDGLEERGKTPHFYLAGKPVLHFHGAGAGLEADIRPPGAADWDRVPAATPADRAALLARVGEVLATRTGR
jgi:hypothetical protein